ncbi:MAG TPA: hypothetical protein VFT60_09320 [Bryobacteraceae bacterium]|nr:hypothetical protein [Bryobacteraceae bacterium]
MGHPRNRWDFALAGAVLLLLVWQLFAPPALSVANDHDFEKILGHICYAPVETNQTPFFDFAALHYSYDADSCIDWPMRTTNEAAFAVGWWLNGMFHSRTDFDLRYMGIVYGLIFLGGFVTMQRALRRVSLKLSVLAQTAWIVVFCNAVYVPMFNTLYFDALSLATLTGALAAMAVVALEPEPDRSWIAGAAIWLALLAGSKGQHAPLALLCVPALWIRPRRLAMARAVGTAAIVAGAWLSLTTMPRFYQGEATFNALFYRILPAVADPQAYLAETKIPVSWARYSGEVAFAEDVPLRDPYYEEQFGKWFGPVDLIRLYLRHPSAAWIIARENLDEASMDRVRIRMAGVPHRLSNYEESQGKARQAISHFFTVWAGLKNAVFGARPVLYAVWIAAVIGVAWMLAPPGPRMRLLLAIVTAALAAEFSICMLDGADGGRHLTIFNALLDFLVCCDVVLGARYIAGYMRRPEGLRQGRSHAPQLLS